MPKSTNKKNKNEGAGKLKERHIVTWTQQEDDILREQITNHGTDNWANIASKFKDKTTRQCRRRWYSYLNSDFKKGGWSLEEDMLLCEAQKIFGNKWTEIAKVVSGRTDNAVKNRFSTLCKKRAKHEALGKENNVYANINNKRILTENGLCKDAETGPVLSFKKMRMTQIANPTEDGDGQKIIRPPLSVLDPNIQNIGSLLTDTQPIRIDSVPNEAHINKNQETFLKKDDPKIKALLEQAELLSSLAIKVNSENTNQSLENAWKILQDFLNQTKQNDELQCKFPDMEFPLEVFIDLIEDLRSSNETSSRQTDVTGDSPGNSEISVGSILLSNIVEDKTEQAQLTNEGKCSLISHECHDPNSIEGDFSPVQVIPQFTSLAAGIPTPIFSESVQNMASFATFIECCENIKSSSLEFFKEKKFLMKTLGVESSSPNLNIDHSQPPPPPPPPTCKRSLLQSL